MPKKLLVADDSLTIQKVIRLALSGAAAGLSDGYDIQAVSDGNDALQQISLFRPDIVLIDVSLPGKSAFEVKRSTNQHRDLDLVRFVLMSSAFEKVDEQQVQEVEFHGRLTKPFDPAHLRDVLIQVLAQVPQRAPVVSPPIPEEPTLNLHAPPPLPELPNEPMDPEGDIRDLTESTIRLSGLAEFESRQRKEMAPLPSEPPIPAPPEPPSALPDDFGWSVQETSLKPPSMMMDSGNSTFPIAPPQEMPNERSGFIPRPPAPDLGRPQFTPPPPASSPAPQASVDSARIEAVIRQEVEKALQKMSREMIPEVAERVIKEEIRKLLTQAP